MNPKASVPPVRPQRRAATPPAPAATTARLSIGPGVELADPAGIHQGDALTLLDQVEPASVNCIWVDPPYNFGVAYEGCSDDMSPSDYYRWAAQWLGKAAQCLTPDGHLWLLVPDEHVAVYEILAERRFGLSPGSGAEAPILRTLGPRLYLRHHIVWYYTFGVNSPKKMTRSHAHLLHFVASRDRHKWNPDQVRIPSARQAMGDKRANPQGRLPDDTWILRPTDPAAGFDPMDTVQHFPRICGTHAQKGETPNQVPEQLVARSLRLCTDPGDLVLDCFGGSGTTAAVARKLGRRYITIEQSPVYLAQSMIRLGSIRAGDPLDGVASQFTTPVPTPTPVPTRAAPQRPKRQTL